MANRYGSFTGARKKEKKVRSRYSGTAPPDHSSSEDEEEVEREEEKKKEVKKEKTHPNKPPREWEKSEVFSSGNPLFSHPPLECRKEEMRGEKEKSTGEKEKTREWEKSKVFSSGNPIFSHPPLLDDDLTSDASWLTVGECEKSFTDRATQVSLTDSSASDIRMEHSEVDQFKKLKLQ